MKLRLTFRQRIHIVRDLSLAVRDLLPCICQFLLRIRNLVLGIIELAFGIVNLGLRVRNHGIIAQLHPLLKKRVHHILVRIDIILVFIGINLVILIEFQINCRIIIAIKGLRRKKSITGQLAAAQRSRSALEIQVQRVVDDTDYLVAVVAQHIQCVLVIVRGNLHRAANGILTHQPAVHQAFVGGFRHPPCHQPGFVDPLRDGEQLHHILILIHGIEHVHTVRAGCRAHVIQCGHGCHIILRQPQRGQQLIVIELPVIHIILHRRDHDRAGDFQADKNTNSKRDNRQNRQVSAQGMFNFPQSNLPHNGLPVAFSFYHSISSIGTMLRFSSIFSTCPLRMEIIRSAIGVIAWLCVITTTVLCILRQASCRSCSTALPVT